MTVWQDIRASRATAVGFASMGMIWAAFAAQVPTLKAQIGASDAEFGLCFLISNIGTLTAIRLASRIDRRLGAQSLRIMVVAMGVLILLPAMVGGLAGFAAGMVLASASSGVSDVLLNARIAENEARHARPLMNLNHAIYSFTFAGCAIVTGWLREAGLAPVQIFGCISGVILLLSGSLYAPHSHVAAQGASPSHRVGRVLVWMAGLVFLTGFLAEQSVDGWSALHLERTLGGSPAQGAMGPAILGLTMGFGRLFGQLIVARVSDMLMMGVACLVSALGLTLAALAPGLALAYVGFAVMGLGVSVVVPLAMALVGRVVPQSERVAAIGRASVIGYGAFLIGPSLIGLTSDLVGLRMAFLLVAGLLVAVAVILVPMIARRVQAGRLPA